MSMSHKAFLFDWQRFQCELAPLILLSLADGDSDRLVEFGNAHLSRISDPYEGQPLSEGWIDHLEAGDVQEIADHVLTAFYDPTADGGVGEVWQGLDASLTLPQRVALLGCRCCPAERPFDPGRMGAYFQDPPTSCESFAILGAVDEPALAPFLSLLRIAIQSGKGLYVTF